MKDRLVKFLQIDAGLSEGRSLALQLWEIALFPQWKSHQRNLVSDFHGSLSEKEVLIA